MHCPNCGTEVQSGATQCPQCEIAIAWDGNTATFQMPEDDVTVFVATDSTMLPIIESLLTANEIPYTVINRVTQDLVGWGRINTGFSPVTGPPIVKVHASQAEAARELIASANRDLVVPADDAQPE